MLSRSARDSMEEATGTYELFVTEARTYLETRGIDLSVANTYRLGYVAVPEVGHEQYEGRLAIPYVTKAGVVNLKFRCIRDHECKEEGCPKYLGLSQGTRLYNVSAFFRPSTSIAIAEGEFDALVLNEYVMPAVGVPGAQNWRPFYERCFADYEKVFVFADGDEAGRDFARQVSSQLDGATVIHMPHGTDVNQVYLDEGPNGLRKRAGIHE